MNHWGSSGRGREITSEKKHTIERDSIILYYERETKVREKIRSTSYTNLRQLRIESMRDKRRNQTHHDYASGYNGGVSRFFCKKLSSLLVRNHTTCLSLISLRCVFVVMTLTVTMIPSLISTFPLE